MFLLLMTSVCATSVLDSASSAGGTVIDRSIFGTAGSAIDRSLFGTAKADLDLKQLSKSFSRSSFGTSSCASASSGSDTDTGTSLDRSPYASSVDSTPKAILNTIIEYGECENESDSDYDDSAEVADVLEKTSKIYANASKADRAAMKKHIEDQCF